MPSQPSNIERDEDMLRKVGGSEVADFMEAQGFSFAKNEHNTYGYWFNQGDQMTIGLPQAKYMYDLFKAREERLVREAHLAKHYPRPHGKTLLMFQEFMDAIDQGKTAEWHGKDYVVLSRKQYENLVAKTNKTTVYSESSTFPIDAPQQGTQDSHE